MQLNDANRRGLRTAIDVLLAAISSGLLLPLINVLKEPDLTLAEFSTLTAALTPVLSVIKNSVEDKVEKSLLVSKQRPVPDPLVPDEALVQATDVEVDPSSGEWSLPLADQQALLQQVSAQVVFGSVPPGQVMVAVDPSDVDEADEVLGFTQ